MTNARGVALLESMIILIMEVAYEETHRKSFKMNKASGPDDMSTIAIKTAIEDSHDMFITLDVKNARNSAAGPPSRTPYNNYESRISHAEHWWRATFRIECSSMTPRKERGVTYRGIPLRSILGPVERGA